jgi:hypothetical protein
MLAANIIAGAAKSAILAFIGLIGRAIDAIKGPGAAAAGELAEPLLGFAEEGAAGIFNGAVGLEAPIVEGAGDVAVGVGARAAQVAIDDIQ